MPHDPPPAYDSKPYNVIVFGESGVGKSSVVNLIAGQPVAETSPDAGACTFASRPYHVVLESYKPYCVWDTIGLNEPEISREDYLRAIKHAYMLIKGLEHSGGVHLLLLCMRGRITKSVQQNYTLFLNILCEKKVPLGVVVTNLENEPCMEGWWTANEEVFKKYGISANGHACITAIPGIEGVFRERKEESKKRMHKLLLELTMPAGEGWKKEDVQAWFTDLLGKMMKMLPWRHGRSGQPTSKELMEKLISECRFSRRDAIAIANCIETVRGQSDQSSGPGSDERGSQ